MTDTIDKHLPTVLYVEDNAGDALLLEEALRIGGHAVEMLVLSDGDKALRYFQVKESARDIPPPHCILLDQHLPMVTGSQLLRFLRSSTVFDRTPVFLFAEQERHSDLLRNYQVEPKCFLTKPQSWQGFLDLAAFLMRQADSAC